MSILNEMHVVHGTKSVNGTISYVPQDAWVLSATFRENIVMGGDFDAERYRQAVESSALVQVHFNLKLFKVINKWTISHMLCTGPLRAPSPAGHFSQTYLSG